MPRAVLYTASVYVDCPKCNESLPSPETGSFLWTLQEVADAKERTCACGAVVTLKTPSRVEFR